MAQSGHKIDLFSVDTQYAGALDGVRALSVLTVLWFHFWQQTWLMPAYATPFLSAIGINTIDFNMFRRCGYLAVDFMILLSGFVLFLPHARQVFEGTSTDGIGRFYRKRAARILPSYLLATILMFLYAVSAGFYNNTGAGFLWADLFAHVTFGTMLFESTYLFSQITGVLWTVAIEVMFYAIFPFLAKAFKRFPLLTYGGMLVIGLSFTYGFAMQQSNTSFMVNRFLTFFPVFATGMMGAYLYVGYANRVKHKAPFSIAATVVTVLAAILLVKFFRSCLTASLASWAQTWQLQYRFPLALTFGVFVLSLCISIKPLRAIFSCGVFRYLSAISFNMYLWHQWLMVRLRESYGFTSGRGAYEAGATTQWTLTLEALLLAIALASLLTYAFEKPLANLIMGKYKKSKRPEIQNASNL